MCAGEGRMCAGDAPMCAGPNGDHAGAAEQEKRPFQGACDELARIVLEDRAAVFWREGPSACGGRGR